MGEQLTLEFEKESLNLQRKLEALEGFVKEDYEKISRRILVLESILLKAFGSDAVIGGEKIVHLLDENMMRLRSSTGSTSTPTENTPTKSSEKEGDTGNTITRPRRGRPPKKRILPRTKSTPSKALSEDDEYSDLIKIDRKNIAAPRLVATKDGDVIEMKEVEEDANVIVTGELVADGPGGEEPEFILHGMDDEKPAGEEDVAVVVEHDATSGDVKDVVITRSGRRSKPNPKFDWDVVKQEPEEVEEMESEVINWEDIDIGVHICDICGKGLSNASNLRVHRRSCSTSSRHWKFACDFCNEKFPTPFKRDYHTKVHTEHRPFRCEAPGCSAAFKFNIQLNVHRKVHQTSREYSCTVCGKKYKHKSGLSIHMLVHKQLKIYACIKCDKKFDTRTHVKRHLRQFHKCEDEDIEIPKDESLLEPPPAKKPKKAGRRPPRRPVERVVCDQCGACVLRNNFKHHLGTHEILVNCDQCGKGFSTEFGLKSHIEHAHDLDKPFLCNYPDCESRFNSISNLRTHLISHTEERRYRCEPCNRSYKHKGGLKVHINSSHSKDKQFPCSFCSRIFDTRTHLKRHVIKVHSLNAEEAEKLTKIEKVPKTKPRLTCDLCPKTYKTKHDLRLHKNATHTHETNFPCPYCDKVFYRKNHQKRHLLKVHDFKEEPIEEPKEVCLDDMELQAVEVEMDEIPTSSDGGGGYPVYQSFEFKPGTVVEIVEYDGETMHHIEEISYKV